MSESGSEGDNDSFLGDYQEIVCLYYLKKAKLKNIYFIITF